MAAPQLSTQQFWLANAAGTYRSFLTARGTGFSSYRDHLLTAWDADPVEDAQGCLIYVRDLDDGSFWTAGAAPLPQQNAGSSGLSPGLATLRRSHAEIVSTLECAVLRDQPMELRRLRLRNDGDRPRRLEVTSYIEVVLNHPGAHAAHPTFSKLFVQTRRREREGDLIASRRPRGHDESHPLVGHALLGAEVREWETDRACFLGRGRDWRCPRAMTGREALSGTTGNVLDPVLSLRTVLCLEPGETCSLAFVLTAADEAQTLMQLLDDCRRANIDELLTYARNPAGWKRSVTNGEVWLRLADGFGEPAPAAATTAAIGRGTTANGPIAAPDASEPLRFFNGHGGFSSDGKEYVIRIDRDGDGRLRLPPMPWTNVLANERFGCIVSEKGAATLWSGNSREHRLSPWRNDPVADPHDEAFYLRDEATGCYWSPLPGPVAGEGPYEVRHGFGYSLWRHRSQELDQEVCQFVARSEPLQFVRLRLTNSGSTARRISLVAYLRWVLGGLPIETRQQVAVSCDPVARTVLARNPQAAGYSGNVAFVGVVGAGLEAFSWTGDRRSFLGDGGSADSPASLRSGNGLNGRTNGDPCAALRVEVEIPPGSMRQVTVLRGEAGSDAELHRLLAAYGEPAAVDAALAEVRNFWSETLGRVQLHSPSSAIDLMVNGWAAYQNLACRLWARSAFYQSGGAFGFRDQLQDAAAMLHYDAAITRRQILANAAHQFVEGDVLHWWHAPDSRGIRTRFADDLLWLPYLTAFYLRSTGDRSVLAEQVRYIAARQLIAGEDETFLKPEDSGQRGDLYEHCCRAIDRSLRVGVHGLPFFGSGDWNDGMNRVGREGRGESVWMGFFLHAVLGEFLPICVERGDAERAARYAAHRGELQTALNDGGWDGAWYRRAYYDDGSPLGSRDSDECRIDALAQAWAVIAGVAPGERADAALDALEAQLISDEDALIRLLAPPFVDTPHDPGYIKGYVAGVRENGGQYTHAALWVVKAMAEAGRTDRAAALLEMLSPVSHGGSAARIERYKVEPYVIAADVYGVAPHVGRGGWTWYTGSAGWFCRVALESIVGLTLENGRAIRLQPRIPSDWPGFKISYCAPDGCRYDIEVDNAVAGGSVASAVLDDRPLQCESGSVAIPLLRDDSRHRVYVRMGSVG